MSVRTYIGARYVPKFSGTYSALTAYEALEVVDDGAGTTYIAKVPVPVGTPLNDTDYWAVYGASSGAILDLQNRMGTAENDISTLQGQMTTAQGNITSLDGRVDILENRRYVVISDSYGLVRGGNTPWTDFVQTYLGASSDDFFTFSEGSMGFNNAGDHGNTVQDLIIAEGANITYHNTITDFVMALGCNDIAHVAGLEAAISSCVNYVRGEYPNARIYIGFIGNNDTKNTAAFNNYVNAVTAYKNAAGAKGVAYIEGCENVMHNTSFFQGDGIHPTTDGCKAIAAYVAGYLNDGASYNAAVSSTLTSTYLGASASLRQAIVDDTVSLYFAPYAFGTACTIGSVDSVAVATIDNPIINGIGGMTHFTPIILPVSGGAAMLYWYVYAGSIYLLNPSSTSVTITTGVSCRGTAASYPTIEA